jgi:hypothetical protein
VGQQQQQQPNPSAPGVDVKEDQGGNVGLGWPEWRPLALRHPGHGVIDGPLQPLATRPSSPGACRIGIDRGGSRHGQTARALRRGMATAAVPGEKSPASPRLPPTAPGAGSHASMPSSSASSGTWATGFDEKEGEEQGRAECGVRGGVRELSTEWGTVWGTREGSQQASCGQVGR